MNVPCTILASLAVALAAAGPAQAQSRRVGGGSSGQGSSGGQIPQIKVELQLQLLELDGKFGMSLNGGPLPDVDYAGDLDLDDDFWAWGLRVGIGDIRMGWLDFGLVRFASLGKQFLRRNLQIHGVDFPTGTFVESRLDLRWSELVLGQLYSYGGGYYVGYEVGGAEYHYRMRVRAPNDGLHERVDETPGLPLVGVKLGIGLGQVALLLGSIRGNFFSFGKLDSNVIETTIELRLQLSTWLLIHAGWQYFRLDAKFALGGSDAAFTDFFTEGAFLGIEIRLG